MTFETVTFQKDGAVARVALNRPDRLNLYNVQMRDDLHELFTVVRDDPDIRAMVISGVGRGFCAGADLSEFGTAPSPTIARDVRWKRDVWGVLRNMDKITIAAMHGFALGAGLEMALLCDLRLAAEGTLFGLPEVSLGLIPGASGTQGPPRVVRPGTALAMILTCERIDATEAHRIGLVHRVLPEESLMAEADVLARRILAAGPLALTLAKEAVSRGLDMSLEKGLGLEARLNDLVYATADAWEDLRAHVEGRELAFLGR